MELSGWGRRGAAVVVAVVAALAATGGAVVPAPGSSGDATPVVDVTPAGGASPAASPEVSDPVTTPGAEAPTAPDAAVPSLATSTADPPAPGERDAEGAPPAVARRPAVVAVPVSGAELAAGEVLHEGTPFQLVALTWDDPRREIAVQVSVREQGTWSDWVVLHADEHGDGRGGTEPLTTGALADGVRLRPDGATALPTGARLELVDPGESTEEAPSLRTARAAVAAAPTIITRAQWGADESINTHRPSPARYLEMAFVHHTATTNAYGPEDSAAQVRSIYLYHAQGRDWGDIGYNFVVDRFGQVFEGRSGGVEVPEIGAHAGSGFNTGSVGVAALGTFDSDVPGVTTERIAQVIAWKFALHDIDPHATVARVSGGAGNVRWGENVPVWLPAISGHRHSSFTSCPGEALFARLPAVRDRVAQILADGSPAAWLAGTFDGIRVERDRVTVRGWAAALDPGAQNVWVRARTAGRTASAPVGLPRPDVQAVHPPYGGRTGYEATLSLPVGNYQVCVDVLVPGRPMATVGCRWAAVDSGRILANLESVTPLRSAVRLQGWALQTGMDRPSDVHVYVDGAWGGSFVASAPRPDVAAAYPAEGANHGIDVQVPVAGGRRTVCAYAISQVRSISNPLIGCRTVDVSAGEPVGRLEAAYHTGETARLVGWTFDPDGGSPLDVHVYRDGAWAGRLVADRQRPDVQRVHGLAGATHGLDGTVPLPLGRHQVCAYAINVGPPATNPLLGCAQVGIPLGMPFGTLDSTVRSRSTPSVVRVSGWLIDPDTRGPAEVHVYVNGRWAGASTADRSRPDLVAPYPGFGAGHGFELDVTTGAGPSTVCVYGINVGVGQTNPLVACRTVA